MFCPHCGAENSAQAPGCRACGVALQAPCAACAATLPVGARFCPACGSPVELGQATSRAEPLAPITFAGERKLVTVLFADFAGFTAFVEKRDAEDVQDYMRGVWRRLDGIIAQHGGITEKHIGDAVMAIFGSRQAREDDAVEAVRAALAMQQCALQTQPGERSAVLQMRIGINTGWVVLGPAATSGERLVTGDPVNVASRLEHNAPVGGVLISQDTYRQVYGSFDVQSLPPLGLRGKSEPVQTYLVLRARPRSLARTLRGIEGVDTELVGREKELERLCAMFRTVLQQRQLAMVTVLGEAGVGKSRLMHEFRKWLEVLPQPIRFFYGRGSAEWADSPFALFRDVFSARFEIQESDPLQVAKEKFARGFTDLIAHAACCPPEPLYAFVGQLIGFDFTDAGVARERLSDPDEVRNRAFQDLARFFQAISQPFEAPAAFTSQAEAGQAAGESAVLLVLEDIHWADDSSLELVEYLAEQCRGLPMMILSLARPALLERRPGWARLVPGHTRLSVVPLSPRDSDLLIQRILQKATDIPPSLRDLVLSGADGNPFYIEELIKMLIDQQVIVTSANPWRFEPQRLLAAPIPPTLTGVLQARLDRLTALERAVLQRASVVGQVFWSSAVERLSRVAEAGGNVPYVVPNGTPLEPVENALEELQAKDLIHRRESSAFSSATEYAFKHELLRNAAYDGLLKKSRRAYHAEVAAWLIEHSGERISEFTVPVAVHFERAGLPAQAAEWYGRAGQQARAGYAPATGSAHFRKALELVEGQPCPEARRLEWYEGLSDTLSAQARFAEAEEHYQSMRALAEKSADLAAQARCWNGLAFLHERLGQNRASVEAAQRAETLARQAGPGQPGEIIRALHLQGWALYRLGDAPAVLNLAEQTLKLCQESGDPRGLATSLKLRGVAQLQLAHFDEAEGCFRQGLALSEESGDRRNTAAMWSNLGETARLRGDFAAAVDFYQKALGVARDIGHRESETIYLNNLGGARLGLGQFKEAEADLRQVMALINASQSCTLSETYGFLSTACLGQGKISEAIDAAQQALQLAERSENHLDLGGAWRALGSALAAATFQRSGESATPSQASRTPDECFAESIRIFEQIHAEGEQARTLQVWAQFEAENRRGAQSREKAEAAQAILVRLGSKVSTSIWTAARPPLRNLSAP